MRRTIIGMAAAAVLTLPGCGGGSQHPSAVAAASSSSGPTLADLRGRYVALAGPLNRALDADLARARAALARRDLAGAGAAADDAAAALNRYDQQLLRLPWPAGLRGDARAVVDADLEFAGRLRALSSQSALSVGQWSSDLLAAEGRSGAAVSVLRAEIGLPPAK